jgi:hypothetical protein
MSSSPVPYPALRARARQHQSPALGCSSRGYGDRATGDRDVFRHEDFDALQDPLPADWPFACTFQEPDMELPDTEPEYWIAVEPTVPKLMELPFTVPVMWVGWLPSEEIIMVPLTVDPDCCQLRWKVPVNEPL